VVLLISVDRVIMILPIIRAVWSVSIITKQPLQSSQASLLFFLRGWYKSSFFQVSSLMLYKIYCLWNF
jgi:hypothetical protein